MVRPRNHRSQAIVYDPDAHREFVTGFRRRKQARRQEAAASATSAEKEARRQMRKEKREVFRATSQSAREHGDSDDSADENEISREETTYHTEDSIVTAVIAPLETAFDKRALSSQDGGKLSPTSDVADDKSNPKSIAKAIKKPSSAGRKRKVSYTHTLSKLNKRKLKLKKRRAEKR